MKNSYIINYNTLSIEIVLENKEDFIFDLEDAELGRLTQAFRTDSGREKVLSYIQETENDLPSVIVYDVEDESLNIKLRKDRFRGKAVEYFNPTNIFDTLDENNIPYSLCREHVKFINETTVNYFIMTDADFKVKLSGNSFYNDIDNEDIITRDLKDKEVRYFKANQNKFKKIFTSKEGDMYERKLTNLRGYIATKDFVANFKPTKVSDFIMMERGEDEHEGTTKYENGIEVSMRVETEEDRITKFETWIQKDGRMINSLNETLDTKFYI